MGVSTTGGTIKPARVLMTADAVGGVWRYAVDLASGFAQHGIKVLIATLGPRPSTEQRREVSRLPGVDLRESEFALEWMPNPWRDVDTSGEWLLALQAKFGADIVHLNGYSHGALPWGKPVVVTAHSCVCSWWRAVHGCAPVPQWDEYKRRVSLGLAACDAIAAPSCYMASAIEREYGMPRTKIFVIHNFSRIPASSPKGKDGFFLAAGRAWDVSKNFQLLKRIAHRLSWQIRIASTLTHKQLQSEMARASVFVHPALYEPFGLSILEAARNRCGLVLSDIPSLRELWEGAAEFIDARDEDRWVFELNRLSGDADARDRLGRLAHLRAARYRSAGAVRKYIALYADLIRTNGRNGAAAA